MTASVATGSADHADESFDFDAVSWVPSGRDFLWPTVMWMSQVALFTQFAFGDHLLVMRVPAALYLVWFVPHLVVSATGTVHGDADGLSVRYRWLTRRTGLQRRWEWSSIEAVNDGPGLTLRIRGRWLQFMPLFFMWRSRPGLLRFGDDVRMRAAVRSIPALHPRAGDQFRRRTR